MTADGPAGGLGGGDGLVGEGGEFEPPPSPPYDETIPWVIRDYQDPVHGTIPIVEGRAIVSWKNYTPAILPADPNYFDGGVEPTGTWYTNPPYPTTRLYDTDIAAFIAAENLTAFSEWSPVASAGFLLPQGTTVEYAIANWPLQYPNLIAAVEPDEVGQTTACVPQFPDLDPGDDAYFDQWAINPWTTTYNIRARQAWKATSGLGVSFVEIAIKYPSEVRQRIAATDSPLPGDLAFCGHLNSLKALEDPWL